MNWKKLILIIALLTTSLGLQSEMKHSHKTTFHGKSPSEGLWEAMTYYGISDSIQPIVYCQAKLESNLGKATNKNNLFGLTRKGKLRSFSHWSESVEAYSKLIYAKYKEENHKDYYHFLMHIPPYDKPYARDPHYIKKLKHLVNQLK